MNFILGKYQIIHEDSDLIYFEDMALQKDRSHSVEYSEDYFAKYVGYEGTPMSISLNESRVQVTERYCEGPLLDIGIGSGEFIKSSNIKVFGFDINPFGIDWLRERDLFLNPYKDNLSNIKGLTFWDSLEHFPEPQDILKIIKPGQYVFVSIPIFHEILKIKESKHYRPNEHFYYFSIPGLIRYMADSGFDFLEEGDAEIKAGREDIFTFVFLRQS